MVPAAFTSPFRSDRARVRAIAEFTGISSPYEAPHAPELAIDTGTQRLADSVDEVMALLQPRLLVGSLRVRS